MGERNKVELKLKVTVFGDNTWAYSKGCSKDITHS